MHSLISKIPSEKLVTVLRSSKAVTFFFCAALLGYAIFISRHMGAYAAGSDSSGYMNAAKLLGEGKNRTTTRGIFELQSSSLSASSAYLHIPLGWRPSSEGMMTPTYPIGLPLMILAAAKVFGWSAAPGIVVGMHSLAGLILTYALGRLLGLSRAWAGACMIILGASPLFILYSLQTMTDVPSLTWCTASMLLAWQSRQHPRRALWAGASLAMAVLIRPANILMMPAVLIGVGASWRRLLWVVAGGVPGALFFFWYNWSHYGRPLETGYGNILGEFTTTVLPVSLRLYITWLPVLITPLVFLAPMVIFVRGLSKAAVAMLILWFLAYLIFYSVYIHTAGAWWYLRFLLSCLPALVLAGALVGQNLIQRITSLSFFTRLPWLGPVLGCTLMVGVLINSRHWLIPLSVLSPERDERQYADGCIWAAQHLPANAIIATSQASGAVCFYTTFPIVRWDVLAPDLFSEIETAARRSSRPIFAIIFPHETEDALHGHMRGNWRLIHAVQHVQIWQRDFSTSDSPSKM